MIRIQPASAPLEVPDPKGQGIRILPPWSPTAVGNGGATLYSITGLSATQSSPSSADTIFNQIDATAPFDFTPWRQGYWVIRMTELVLSSLK